jgi:decaprenyl-phosphate phosphoribosyltransferase
VGTRPSDLLRATRPRQWPKNLLVVAAPLAGGRLLEQGVAGRAVAAFGVFVLASASVYLLNDLLDRDLDARHPVKRHRPIASGAVTPRVAGLASVVLAFSAVIAAHLLGGPELTLVIAGYLMMTAAYSRWLKHQPLLDIALIAAGFLLRAVAGGVATGTPLSTLFLVTATAGALFIAAGKRASELDAARAEDGAVAIETRPGLAEYSAAYLRTVWTIAATVALVGGMLWAIEIAGAAPRPGAARAAIGPFALLLLRYAWWIDRGEAEAPEEVLRRDPALPVLGLIGLVLVQLGLTGG